MPVIAALPRHGWPLARLREVSDGDLQETLEYHANSISRMARALGVAKMGISGELRRRGIRRKTPDYRRRRLAGIATSELQHLFDLNHRNTRPVAELLGVSKYTLIEELKRRGIPVKNGVRLVNWSRELLIDLYWRQEKSMPEIAALYGVRKQPVYAAMKRFGVKARDKRSMGRSRRCLTTATA